MAQKRKRNILAEAKGYRFGRSKKKAQAREAIYHAQLHAFAHRKDKKNDFRRMWTVRINAALMSHGIKYSRFIKMLKDHGYDGPSGMQCYGIQGNSRDVLSKSMDTWKAYQRRYAGEEK